MYFTRQSGKVCHLLDHKTGRAPAPCGARPRKVALINLRDGEPSRFIMAEKPLDVPLCQHCRKYEERMRRLTFKEEIMAAPVAV